MNKIEFRKAQPEDIPAILEITKKAFTQYADTIKNQNVAALTESRESVAFDMEHKHIYVCLVDGSLVGSVRFEVLSQNIAYLSRFAVDPEIQSLGIGGLLLEKVRLECLNLGVRAITLYTASKMRSTVAFYLKNGYYIHNITKNREYIRAFMVNELTEMDEMFDYEAIVGDK